MIRLSAFITIIVTTIGLAIADEDWIQQFPDSHPSERYDHSAAYIGGDQILLFGGYSGYGSHYDDTWVYDLSEETWTLKSPSSHPPPRLRHKMAYIGGDQVLLFGGHVHWDQSETWVYDLSEDSWTQRSPFLQPSPRLDHAMAYIGGDQVMLFTGWSLDDDNGTWIYDNSQESWIRQMPSPSPSVRSRHAMAYMGGDQVLLYGGQVIDANDETWVYDLSESTWTRQFPSIKPPELYNHAMAYIGGDQVLLVGGLGGYPYGETWIYDFSENSWTQDVETTQPVPRYNHTLSETSLDGSGYPVLFGGDDFGGADDETWIFGGGDYQFPFGPMDLTIDLIDEDTGRISWYVVPNATEYDLYRSSTTSFSGISNPWQIVTAPITEYEITGGLGNPDTNYCFMGIARSETQTSIPSNIMGEFDFSADINE